ncbi:hypothetical protein [Microbacterium sp. KUDC0406]|nr:hypothetical protein [Microbacterium sp. KUDC0406]
MLDRFVNSAPPKNPVEEAAKQQARSTDRYEAILVYRQEERATRSLG